MNSYVPNYLKYKNTMTVFRLIQDQQTVSRGELVRITGMSFPTVLKTVNRLLDLKIIAELEEMEPVRGAGRRGHLLRFQPGALYALGIEFEGQLLNMGMVDLNGACHHRQSVFLPDSLDINEIENCIMKETETLMKLARQKHWEVVGIGISLPGVDNQKENKILLRKAFHITAPTSVEEAFPRLTREIALPVFLGNDVNFACRGESFLRRCSPDYQDFLFVSLGSGLGASFFLNGAIWEGCSFQAGEIGRFLLTPPDKLLSSPPTYIENMINIEALSSRFHLNFSGTLNLDSQQKEVVCSYLCPYLSHLFINLFNLLDIRRCILTGIIPSVLGEELINQLTGLIGTYITDNEFTIEPSVSSDTGIIGAAVSVFDRILPVLFTEIK